jgi:hypothetical protein
LRVLESSLDNLSKIRIRYAVVPHVNLVDSVAEVVQDVTQGFAKPEVQLIVVQVEHPFEDFVDDRERDDFLVFTHLEVFPLHILFLLFDKLEADQLCLAFFLFLELIHHELAFHFRVSV